MKEGEGQWREGRGVRWVGGAVEGGEGRYIGEWEGERGGEGQWREGKGGT